MVRIFPGVCHLPEDAQKLRARTWRRCASLLAAAVICIFGCSSQKLSLSSTSLSPAAAANLASSANPASDPDRPNVSRLQKPDSTPIKRAETGSILDLATYQASTPSNGEVAAHIRATVNGQAILDEEVREAVYPYLVRTQSLPEPERTARRKAIFDKELQQLVERELILQDMFARLKDRKQALDKLKEAAGKEFDKKMKENRKAMNIKSDEEIKAFFRMQGLSLDGVRRQVERNFMAMEYMRNRVFPAIERIGLEQIREYYDTHPEAFQVADSVAWQDIFIDAGKYPDREAARQFALQLIAKAKAGEDFRQLVTQYDQGNSSYQNGEGYGHRKGEIKPPEAEPILFGMHDGELGLVELTNGFHIVRLVKREVAGLKPFDEKTQTSIRNKLQNEAWEKEYQRILRELKRKAYIEYAAKAR